MLGSLLGALERINLSLCRLGCGLKFGAHLLQGDLGGPVAISSAGNLGVGAAQGGGLLLQRRLHRIKLGLERARLGARLLPLSGQFFGGFLQLLEPAHGSQPRIHRAG